MTNDKRTANAILKTLETAYPQFHWAAKVEGRNVIFSYGQMITTSIPTEGLPKEVLEAMAQGTITMLGNEFFELGLEHAFKSKLLDLAKLTYEIYGNREGADAPAWDALPSETRQEWLRSASVTGRARRSEEEPALGL